VLACLCRRSGVGCNFTPKSVTHTHEHLRTCLRPRWAPDGRTSRSTAKPVTTPVADAATLVEIVFGVGSCCYRPEMRKSASLHEQCMTSRLPARSCCPEGASCPDCPCWQCNIWGSYHQWRGEVVSAKTPLTVFDMLPHKYHFRRCILATCIWTRKLFVLPVPQDRHGHSLSLSFATNKEDLYTPCHTVTQ